MNLFVANTDAGWYTHLSELARRPTGLDEANFWRPSARVGFRALSFGEPLVFKLKKAHGHAIVGFGLFAAFRRLPVLEAWRAFGEANGAASLEDVVRRIAKYARVEAGTSLARTHQIGCVLLAAPVFFPRDLWVGGPSDWSDNTVVGKTYDSTVGEGRRIWQACLDRVGLLGQALDLEAPAVGEPSAQATLFSAEPRERYGASRAATSRLGQGTFRYALEVAYGRCAVTGEHSLPALDAAHIVPYGEGGSHALENGLLLRADVHRLFDRGYVTVTPDYEFRVSRRLREDYDNGKVYYQHDGQTIWTPATPYPKPDRARLEDHATRTFLDA
ncbi:HNH endonuclease [Rubrivirga sp.]|uniref:HNH endonuclease n=1 Tax=Rubrivirga sp. TaxID=1885344 RepID=UPI003C786080